MKRRAYWTYAANAYDVAIGYVPDEPTWRAVLKEHAHPEDTEVVSMPFPDTDGRCTRFTSKKGRPMILITVDAARCAERELPVVAAILAHEATHAWQMVKEVIQETTPGWEVEAYSIQAIFQCMLYAHRDSQPKPWKRGSHLPDRT